MNHALLIWLDTEGHTHMEMRTTMTSFDSIEPSDWGLAEDDEILVAMQGGQFMNAWVDGEILDPMGWKN